MLRSMLLSSVRPFYAADDDVGGGAGDDAAKVAADKVVADAAAAGDAAAAAANGDAGGGAGDDAAAKAAADKAAADAAAAATPPAENWKDKELRRKHAQLQEAKRREAEKDAELETLRAIAQRTPPGRGDGAADDNHDEPPARQPASLSRDEINQEAQRIVAQNDFDKSANAADAAGRTRYKADWDKATDTLKTLGGFDGPTMAQILATDDPAQVLYALGSKPEEYQRIMELPEARRQTELVKLGLAPAPKKVVPSGAAAPVDGLRARPRADGDSLGDEVDDETWYARRARQKAAKFEQKRANQNRA